MTLPRELLIAIARAVKKQGGDMDDVEDLVAVWERQHAQEGPRVDRLRHEATNATCGCADGGSEGAGGRCERCCRLIRREARR